MPVTWLEAAVTDLLEIRAFIAEHNPTAAEAVGDRIASVVERLETLPLSGRTGRVPGTRELVVPDLPYIVTYALREDEVVILALRHAARLWPEHF